jgi:hypothetical protein
LILDLDQLTDIRDALRGRVLDGLAVAGKEIKALPAFCRRPAPGLSGTGAVVDVGGTNMRAGLVRVAGRAAELLCLAEDAEQTMRQATTPGRVTPRDFFDRQAALIAEVCRCFEASAITVGYCFSYPATITPGREALFLGWTKGITIDLPGGTSVGKSSNGQPTKHCKNAAVYVCIFFAMWRQLGEMRATADAGRRSADAARQSADIAQRTLIAAQRAWLSVEASVGAPLVFDQNGATTSIAFKIKNVGNSPATHVTPHVWLGVMKEGGPFPLQEQTPRCGEVRQEPFGLGFALFPEQIFPEVQGVGRASWGVNISREEIDKGRRVSADRKHIALFVVGCVDYTFPTDPERHHQTGFIFDFMRFIEGVPVQINPDEGNIPAENLRLVDSPLGMGRYAD